jgi:hypothetical protein
MSEFQVWFADGHKYLVRVSMWSTTYAEVLRKL